jgi:hypothetical protein
MNDASPEMYTVAVPGTDETQEFTRQDLLSKMARGEITPSHWVWSPEAQDWKQISEIPALQPIQKTSRVSSFFNPLRSKSDAAPVTAAAASVAPVRNYSTNPSRKKGGSSRTRTRKEEGFPVFSLVLALLFLAVAGVVAANYMLVEEPLNDSIAETPYVLVPVHAHLGGFVQPGALVIHVLPSQEVTAGNFSDFLFTLATSTPPQPFNQKPFNVVELTPAWVSQYAFSGTDWQQFAQMKQASAEDRKNFLLDHLASVGGQPLIPGAAKLAPRDLKTAREKIWNELMASFMPKSANAQGNLITTDGITVGKAS